MDRASQAAASSSPETTADDIAGYVEQKAAKRSAGKAPQTRKFRPLELIERAKDQIKALTGAPVEGVSTFARDTEGWRLIVTVVELRRVPAGTDVLADYEVRIDESGDVVNYQRGRRYFRNQVGDAG